MVDSSHNSLVAVAQLMATDMKLHGNRRGTGGITNGTSLEQVIMYLLRKDETRNLPKVCVQRPCIRQVSRGYRLSVVAASSSLLAQCGRTLKSNRCAVQERARQTLQTLHKVCLSCIRASAAWH